MIPSATTLPTPISTLRVSLDVVVDELLRVVHGLTTVDTLIPLLAACDGQRQRYTPLDLVVLAVESRRLDLLNAVLDTPFFCPVERSRDPKGDPETLLRLRRAHGVDALFNGALLHERVSSEYPGRLVNHLVWALNARAKSESEPFQSLARAQDHRQALTFWNDQLANRRSLNQISLMYEAKDLNVVGLAVMHDWPDGVRALLDHGVDPYARAASETSLSGPVTFVSPVALAGALHRRECLQVLMQHLTFDPLRRYGQSVAATAKRKHMADTRFTPWRDRRGPGGLDLTFALESPGMVQDPVVLKTLMALDERWTPLQRRRFLHGTANDSGLSPTALQAWETVELTRTAHLAMAEQPSRPRARARL